MRNRRIVLMRKIYWTACDNKNENGETNPHLIGGVPAGIEGDLIYRYEIPSLNTPGRIMRMWEFKPTFEKHRAYGGGRFMTMDDALYDEFMTSPNLDVESHMLKLNNLEQERQDREEREEGEG